MVDYMKNMGGVDRANSAIMSSYYAHRVFRWRVAVWVWSMNMMVHNARTIYNSLVPANKQMTQAQFTMELARTIYTVPDQTQHKLVRTSKKGTCKICYKYFTTKSGKKKRSSCKHRCSVCGPMHEGCFHQHHNHYLLDKLLHNPHTHQ